MLQGIKVCLRWFVQTFVVLFAYSAYWVLMDENQNFEDWFRKYLDWDAL